MNTTATFIGLLFFGWLWGFWGILLAIPILSVAKVVCEANEDWKPVAELLGR
jgi:predicted PurR-regulated permease PerM